MNNKRSRFLLIPALTVLLCMVFALPVSAKSKAYVKAYKALLEKGEISVTAQSYEFDYTGYDEKARTESYTIKRGTPWTQGPYKITGFRVLNVDKKGVPELILQVTSGDNKYAIVATYKGGKVVPLRRYTGNDILLSLGKKTVKVDRNGKWTDNSKTVNSFFYYSKSQKGLVYEYASSYANNYNPKGKQYTSNYNSKTLYTIKSGTLYVKRSAAKSTSGAGYKYYSTGSEFSTSHSMHSAKAYKAYVKKYFKGLKKYKYYTLTAKNIKKYVK